MITINYDREKNTTGVEIGNLTSIGCKDKVTIVFKNIITNEIHYQTELSSNMWTKWSGAELITDVLVFSDENNLIYHHKWDVRTHGDKIEKTLFYYLQERQKRGVNSNGLVIGSHDGRNGHWVYSVNEKMSYVTLIDGSERQFESLQKNYQNKPHVKMFNTIVTVDGGEVTWYQGGEGYTDTVKEDLINSWLPKDNITQVTKQSISINTLMKQNNYDWLHLDVEGIDGDLILALENKPNIIIYESMNLGEEMDKKLSDWFVTNNYNFFECNGNTIAINKNQN